MSTQYYGPQYSPPPTPEKKGLDAKWIVLFSLLGAFLLTGLVIGGLLLSRGARGPATASTAASPSASSTSASPSPTPTEDATTTVTATFNLVDQETADANCEGQGGYADIDTGTTVTILDQKQEIIGSTTLDQGSASGDTCTWEMSFEEVPTDHTQYTFTIAERGGLTQSRKTMIQDEWAFYAQIGE